jgi:hypothetical protein
MMPIANTHSSPPLSVIFRCTTSWNDGCKRTGTAENILPPITSARLQTPDTFSFTYGKVDVRAKMPAGDWLWPGKLNETFLMF